MKVQTLVVPGTRYSEFPKLFRRNKDGLQPRRSSRHGGFAVMKRLMHGDRHHSLADGAKRRFQVDWCFHGLLSISRRFL